MVVDIKLLHTNYSITIDKLAKMSFDKKVIVVTNDTIAPLHLKYLLSFLKAKQLDIFYVLDGEKYKDFATIEQMLNFCFDKKLDRQSLLIAFGGGVIGDMTGFCASIYQRGIEFIQIPTTLLSQVDASVGGKTGINSTYGKNLIGSFWQPQSVFIDPHFLTTLPKRELNAGIAEIVKMAVCFDGDFFNILKDFDLYDLNNIHKIIEKSVKLKAKVVSLDERESGIRAVLNYGHTFAHIIELETDYTTYLHGEAVGIGMCMANMLSVKLGYMQQSFADDITKLLTKYDIPTTYHIKDVQKFYDNFFLDKKASNNKIKFILPFGIGGYKIVDDIKKETILDVLNNFNKAV